MTTFPILALYGPLLARHQRSVLHHLCREMERSGHPEDVRTARWVEEAGGSIALHVFHSLYSPRLRKAAIDALEHIQKAQRRLEQGIYDLCDRCGTTLSPEWMRQHPAALRCPRCIGKERRAPS